MKIELFWIDGCPSAERAKEVLVQVLHDQSIDARVEMIQVRDNADAVAMKFLGSPTIRLNGRDPFAPANASDFGIQCRVYQTPAGLRGSPTKEMLLQAIQIQNSGLGSHAQHSDGLGPETYSSQIIGELEHPSK